HGNNAKVEGLSSGDWVLIDTGDIIIHIFRPEVREFYNIEKMWQAPELDGETVH
ncbi:UNVERIFIED_CONTAM: RsfS/YbeB/iojap family protein, partial [Salmonella enterica subsp. enterica serovar Enteritidis]